ncbi:MAG: DUF4386 family protein [Chloroflexota bacterium]
MKSLQKMGGIAALYEAAAYIFGIVFFVVLVDYAGVETATERLMVLVENQAMMYLMNLVIYVIFGLVLIVLALAVHDRLRQKAPAVMQVATVIALIWSVVVIASGMIFNIGTGVVVELFETDPVQATTVWLAIDTVVNGIGGGVEVLGGLWVLLISWVAIQHGGFPKGLNYVGLLVGMAGTVTLVPAFGEVGGMIFGLGQIAWFIWLGIALMRTQPDMATTASVDASNNLALGHGKAA